MKLFLRIGLPIISPLFLGISLISTQVKLMANNSSVVNKYIQSAKMNGKVLNTSWLTHEQLVGGGHLEMEMGPKPNKDWELQKEIRIQPQFQPSPDQIDKT
jgi:putative alpha-1,2-mannosidase